MTPSPPKTRVRPGATSVCLTALALLCALLVGGVAPTSAHARVRPHIRSVRCAPRNTCPAPRRVRPRQWVRIRGRHFAGRIRVIFRGRAHNGADDRSRRAHRRSSHTLLVRVPGAARSGHVALREHHRGRALASNRGPYTKIVRTERRVATPPPAPVPAPADAANGAAFHGTAMWIWYVSKSNGGNLSSIAARAKAHGVRTVFVKSGDGSSYWSQFSPALVDSLHARGLKVCAWQYVYGTHPTTEAARGAQAVHDGADCLLIDAEAEYEGKYAAAQTYIRTLRSQIGPNYPVALSSFPWIDYHRSFPYSVFLGPGGAQFNVPQIYWKALGTSVDRAFQHTYDYNLPYGRTIAPDGQAYDGPPTRDLMRFRELARDVGAPGVSWWSWQSAGAAQFRGVGPTLATTGTPAPQLVWASVRRGSKGDLTVWAQEHLVGAGQPLTVDGDFGPKTQAAVQAFQAGHGLPATGVVGQATWQALLRYKAIEPAWGGGAHAASLGRHGRSGPKSASLPSRHRAHWPAVHGRPDSR